MIKVNVSNDKIVFQGHALFANLGEDIVCSAVSSIVTTTINGILTFDKDYISYRSLRDELSITINEHNNIVDNLINNMINLLGELEMDYPNNIKIRKEN